MKTVRFGTFETNSSSAHVATICGQKKLEEYKAHKAICVFDFFYSDEESGEVNVVPDKAFKSFEEVLSDIKKWYENPDIEDGKDESYMEIAKKLLDGGFTAKDLENCLVNEGSFGDIDNWEIQELLEEDVYEGTRIHVYDPEGESEPFSAEESLVGLAEIEGPIVSVCSEVCC